MFAHRGIQPVIDAIIELAEHSAKEPFDFQPDDDRRRQGRSRSWSAKDLRAAYKPSPARASATPPSSPPRPRPPAPWCKSDDQPRRLRRRQVRRRLQGSARPTILRRDIVEHRHPHRRPHARQGPPDRLGSRRPAARPRLGPVHPRRDPGPGGRHPGHRRRRADDRRAGRHLLREVHAALQLPALLGRGDGPHGRAGPPRNRPRQAGLAGDPPDAADRRKSSPTRSAWSRRSSSPTARPRWPRSAAPRWR